MKTKYVIVMVILVGGCIAQPQKESVDTTLASLQGLPLDAFFEESYKQLLLRTPQYITALGLAEAYGLRNDKLDNLSDSYLRETQRLEKGILDLLQAYDRESLTPEQRLSRDIYEWYLKERVRGHAFMYYNYTVHHFLGDYNDELVRLFTEYHTIEDKEDAQDYISRLSAVDTQVDQLIEGLKLREKAGVIPPKFIVSMARENYTQYLHMYGPDSFRAEEISVYTVFVEKVDALNLSAEEKRELKDAALKEVKETFIPSYKKILDYLKYLETVSTNDAGVWKFPRGDEYYAFLLHRETSTTLTAEEIHEMGLREVERIQKEMRDVFEQLGYPQDESLSDLMNRAITEAGFYDISTPAGKEALIRTYEAMLTQMSETLTTVVDIAPRAQLIVVGEPGGCGGGYYVGASLDGSRPGAFHTGTGCHYVPKFNAPTVAYHEAIPGHHFQISIAQELELPLMRNDMFFNGYSEGWALYAERLAWELGVYEDNPYENLGRLQLELLRAVRLVTDTGIHSKHWTREEARAYMKKTLADPSGGLANEVERYIVLPGQATGYMVGMLKILELRQKAMDELGSAFDMKEFHQVILGNGGMPLEILEKVVQDYIDAKKGTVFLRKTAIRASVLSGEEMEAFCSEVFTSFILDVMGKSA